MIRVFDNLDSLSHAAATLFLELSVDAATERARFSAALSGGVTPRRTYELLASSPFSRNIPWHQVHFFWGDERCVPADDQRSNVRMAREALLDHIPIPPENVHPVRGTDHPAEAARHYEAELREHFAGGPPCFDLIFLGMGEDGHTASLFPDSPVLREQERWVAEVYDERSGIYRVTMTLPLINQARRVCFLVSGQSKAEVLNEAVPSHLKDGRLPVQMVRPVEGEVIWFVDLAAASKLRP